MPIRERETEILHDFFIVCYYVIYSFFSHIFVTVLSCSPWPFYPLISRTMVCISIEQESIEKNMYVDSHRSARLTDPFVSYLFHFARLSCIRTTATITRWLGLMLWLFADFPFQYKTSLITILWIDGSRGECVSCDCITATVGAQSDDG